MTGHHEVRLFKVEHLGGTLVLPKNWKPFAFVQGYPYDEYFVVARKWIRDEKTTQTEPST